MTWLLTWLFLSIPFLAGCGAMFLTFVFPTSCFSDILKQTLQWRDFWKMTLSGFLKMALSGFWKMAFSSFLKMALPENLQNGHIHIQTYMHRFQWKLTVVFPQKSTVVFSRKSAFPWKSTFILPWTLRSSY